MSLKTIGHLTFVSFQTFLPMYINQGCGKLPIDYGRPRPIFKVTRGHLVHGPSTAPGSCGRATGQSSHCRVFISHMMINHGSIKKPIDFEGQKSNFKVTGVKT